LVYAEGHPIAKQLGGKRHGGSGGHQVDYDPELALVTKKANGVLH